MFQVFYVKYFFVNKLDFMLIKQHLWIIILWICCSYFSARLISRKNFCEMWKFIPSASVGNGIWYTAWVMKNAFRFKHCFQILLSFRLNVMIKMSFLLNWRCASTLQFKLRFQSETHSFLSAWKHHFKKNLDNLWRHKEQPAR